MVFYVYYDTYLVQFQYKLKIKKPLSKREGLHFTLY